ncbi:hypothetical protein Rs2_36954 [Raphanus sativus]|nr:hypothetical protein Rs2_36954 [Raphanus sativus]
MGVTKSEIPVMSNTSIRENFLGSRFGQTLLYMKPMKTRAVSKHFLAKPTNTYLHHSSSLPLFQVYPRHHQFLAIAECPRLILLSEFQIWNPSLRRIFTLPSPKGPPFPIWVSSCKSYSGYDPLEEPLILTLGAQESWRTITKGRCPVHSPTIGNYGRCFHGILYYEARVDDHDIIMSFDVKSESFNTIKYPGDHYICLR